MSDYPGRNGLGSGTSPGRGSFRCRRPGFDWSGKCPCGMVREQICKARELTDKPFGVNIMLLSPYADEVAQVVAEERVAVVTTGAGNPGNIWRFGKRLASK